MTEATPVRHRKEYGKVFRKLMESLYGLGVDAGSLKLERAHEAESEAKGPARARFDVLQRVDNEMFELFEGKTIDELALIVEAIDQTKEIFSHYLHSKKLVNTEILLRFFAKPDPISMKLSVEGSFDKEFATLIIPEAVNNNNRAPARIAASQASAPVREKNPKKVEAGRRASAKRWGGTDLLPKVRADNS